MKYDVKIRVYTSPKAFADTVVTVEADSGDGAALAAVKLADGKPYKINEIVPTPDSDKPVDTPKGGWLKSFSKKKK